MQISLPSQFLGVAGGLNHRLHRCDIITKASGKQANAAATEASNSNGAANPLDFDELSEIIRMVNETDIVELELKSRKFSLAVRKRDAMERPEMVYQQAPPTPSPQSLAPAPSPPAARPPSPSPAPSPSESAPPAASNGSSGGGVEVASPMSGTFYHAPAPGEPAFVKVGDKVTKGQTIGIIEAMKLMNEIEADASGTILEFIADNGSSVTPGQGLVRIKP